MTRSIFNCWNCGQQGTYDTGSRYICHKCDVMWWPYGIAQRTLPDKIAYCGVILDVVDFSDPKALALSSPA
jgi:hypothetical protein